MFQRSFFYEEINPTADTVVHFHARCLKNAPRPPRHEVIITLSGQVKKGGMSEKCHSRGQKLFFLFFFGRAPRGMLNLSFLTRG